MTNSSASSSDNLEALLKKRIEELEHENKALHQNASKAQKKPKNGSSDKPMPGLITTLAAYYAACHSRKYSEQELLKAATNHVRGGLHINLARAFELLMCGDINTTGLLSAIGLPSVPKTADLTAFLRHADAVKFAANDGSQQASHQGEMVDICKRLLRLSYVKTDVRIVNSVVSFMTQRAYLQKRLPKVLKWFLTRFLLPVTADPTQRSFIEKVLAKHATLGCVAKGRLSLNTASEANFRFGCVKTNTLWSLLVWREAILPVENVKELILDPMGCKLTGVHPPRDLTDKDRKEAAKDVEDLVLTLSDGKDPRWRQLACDVVKALQMKKEPKPDGQAVVPANQSNEDTDSESSHDTDSVDLDPQDSMDGKSGKCDHDSMELAQADVDDSGDDDDTISGDMSKSLGAVAIATSTSLSSDDDDGADKSSVIRGDHQGKKRSARQDDVHGDHQHEHQDDGDDDANTEVRLRRSGRKRFKRT